MNVVKKNFILIGALAVMAAENSAHAASTGTITFSGLITDTTCNVDIDGQGPDPTITLPTVDVSQLDVAGKVSGRTPIDMSLSGCTVGTSGEDTVAAYFQPGATVNLTTGRLINSGAATNVSLQLLDAVDNSYSVIKVGSQDQLNDSAFADLTSGSATLRYAVEYYAENQTTPGTVTSSVVYNLMYK
ncbi:MAG: fimbrial protein [Aeromonas hydrophila]